MARFSLSETPHDIWVVAEIDAERGAPTPLTLEMTYGARTAADMMGFYVKVVVLGSALPDVSESLLRAGADRVVVVDHPALAAFAVEPWLKALSDVFVAQSPEFVLFGATPLGDEIAPRLAQRFGGGLISHCAMLKVDDFDRAFVGRRAVFGGDYFEVVVTSGPAPQFATALPDCFGPPYLDASRFGETETVEVEIGDLGHLPPSEVVSFQMRKPKLEKARRIVSVGRQVGDVEAAKKLAAKLGAEFAGARESIDEGYIDESQVVGITGARVSPDVYIALGIRGDTLHAFGIQDARFVVAVHPDPSAPILQQADAAMVGDPEKVASELTEVLRQA
jgi:electron transfer flavoprotein alpha subunit